MRRDHHLDHVPLMADGFSPCRKPSALDRIAARDPSSGCVISCYPAAFTEPREQFPLFDRKAVSRNADADAVMRERVVPPWSTAHWLCVPPLVLLTAMLPHLARLNTCRMFEVVDEIIYEPW
jgi:hypothetical protein